MALTTDPFDSTELAAFISETWPGPTLDEYFANAVAANHFMDLSEFADAGSDIFHVPDIYTNTFSVQSQGTQGAEVTTDAPATADITINVNTHKYIATLLGDKDRVQISRSYNINERYAHKAGGTLMEDFEDALFALWSGLTTNTVGDTATVITDAEIRQGIEKLATLDFPLRECAFFFHTFTYWVQILAIQKYYDASQAGWTKTAPVMNGNFEGADQSRSLHGSLYGIPLYTSSRVVSGLQTHRNLLAHPEAFGFAHQTPNQQRVRFQAAYWLANIGTLAVWDTIYGVSETRDNAAVLLNANSSAIGA